MTFRQLIFCFVLVLLASCAVSGETRCPESIWTIHYHSPVNSQIGVSVTLNGSGPYEFLLDTGSQVTILEPSLAKTLPVRSAGKLDLVSGVRDAQVELVRLDQVQIGPYTVQQVAAAVQSLAQIQIENSAVRGILGEDFLSHFDLLIDRAHHILCLDQTMQMRQGLRGEHVVMRPGGEWESSTSQPILVPVRLSDPRTKDVVLRLDSGTNLPMLYENRLQTAPWAQMHDAMRGHVTGGALEYFVAMPPQDVWIGSRLIQNVRFATPVRNQENIAISHEDGLLPTALFRRVFISYSNHFVIFDPRIDERAAKGMSGHTKSPEIK